MSFTKTTWVPGQLPAQNAAQMNRIEQGIAESHAMYEGHFKAYIPAGYTLNFYNAWVKVANYTAESWDDDNIWDAPNSRLVIPADISAARWHLDFAFYVANHGGYAYVDFFKNGAEAARVYQNHFPNTADRIWRGEATIPVIAGDIIDLRVQCDTNAALSIGPGLPYSWIEGRRVH